MRAADDKPNGGEPGGIGIARQNRRPDAGQAGCSGAGFQGRQGLGLLRRQTLLSFLCCSQVGPDPSRDVTPARELRRERARFAERAELGQVERERSAREPIEQRAGHQIVAVIHDRSVERG